MQINHDRNNDETIVNLNVIFFQNLCLENKNRLFLTLFGLLETFILNHLIIFSIYDKVLWLDINQITANIRLQFYREKLLNEIFKSSNVINICKHMTNA